MPACRCNFHTAFNGFLPFYISKVVFGMFQLFIELRYNIDEHFFKRNIFIEILNDLANVFNSIYFKTFYYGRFLGILFWKNKSFKSLFLGFKGYWQSPSNGL